MRCIQLSEGGFQVVYIPPWHEVPVIRSCQSPVWIWLVHYLHYITVHGQFKQDRASWTGVSPPHVPGQQEPGHKVPALTQSQHA